MRALWLVLLVLSACGDDDPPPIEVSSGAVVARIYPSPAGIELVRDGAVVWSTRRGGGRSDEGAPHGFAATGTRSTTIEMQFGSFKFVPDEDAETWEVVDRLGAITPTPSGASFQLLSGDAPIGTGELTFVDAAGHVRIRIAAEQGDRIQLASTCAEDEHLVGLGGQSFDVDHRGETVPLWVQEDGIGKEAIADDDYGGPWFLQGRKHSTHTPMPMLLSSRGYALAVDTDARAIFALCSEREDSARYEAWERTLDLQVFVGASTRDSFGGMIAWAGKPVRPPVSIFAPWVDALFGSANVRRVAQKLRDNGIASSVIWTEDWRGGLDGGFGYELEEDWRVDTALYPDFTQLGDDLRARGFAFHTYHNTFIDETADIRAEAVANGYAIHKSDGAVYDFTGVKFRPSTMLDLSNPAAVAWAKDVMSEAIALGADGWMADFAEWLPHDATLASGEDALLAHNRYPVDWARMNEEMFAMPIAGRPAAIYFMRAAWLHSQPHTQVMWAGDQQTDFTDGDGLPSVIPIGLGLGLAGFPYFGHDIAGYMSQGTAPTSQELFYRWTSFGALSPIMRTHHGRSARENVQWETDAGTVAHFRRWSRFHMQLVPYLWGSIGSYERDGLPLMRLLALDFPDEDWTWTAIDQYLLGDRILVAPIQVQGATTRSVRLPAGTWYPLFGGPAASGDIEATASMADIPAYVPEGALLVLYPDGVDTVLDAPALAAATTAAEVGLDREVWLFPGVAANPAHARWDDEQGAAGGEHWQWSGRPANAPVPTMATFDGAPLAVVDGAVTVTGDGTLELAGGGTLVIARAAPTARTTVRLR